jgi:type I restriction enzyme, S subunit
MKALAPGDRYVPWRDRISFSCPITLLKYAVRFNPDVLGDDTPDDRRIRYADISSVDSLGGMSEPEELTFASAPSRARRVVRSQDVIISTVRTYLTAIARVPANDENLVVSTGFAVLRSGQTVHPRFLFHWVRSSWFVSEIVARSTGVSYPAINASEIGQLPFPCLSFETQASIADFLDRETARIDDLIAKRQRLIGLLDEERFATIFRLTTKGCLNQPKVKDSGVAWIGEMPAHWNVYRTKHVAKLRTGHTPSRDHGEYWLNCAIPWFSLADVWQIRDSRAEYLGETSEKISELGLANSAARLLPAGTVIVSRTASVGFSGIMPCPMATTQDFVNWVCGPKITPEYLLYVFRSMKNEFRRLTMGSTHQTIYMPDVQEFVTPLPPIEEQHRIVTEIRQKTAKIDHLASLLHQQIERLGEYRSALITAAVTGQVDIRNHRAQEAAACR